MPKSDYIYYLHNYRELNEKYDGRIIVIVEKEVVADYPDLETAYAEAYSRYDENTFLLQECNIAQEPSVKYSLSTRKPI